jgi:hypothetical protein
MWFGKAAVGAGLANGHYEKYATAAAGHSFRSCENRANRKMGAGFAPSCYRKADAQVR